MKFTMKNNVIGLLVEKNSFRRVFFYWFQLKTACGAKSGPQPASDADERSEINGLPYSVSSRLWTRLRGSRLFSFKSNIKKMLDILFF